MAYRKGLGKGKGQGYKNLLFLHDHQVHTRSGHGFKSPQKMPQLIKGTPVVSKFTKAKGIVVSIDPFAVKYKADSKDYVKLSNPKYWKKGGKDMPITEIDEFEKKAEKKQKPSLFSRAKTAYSDYSQKQKEKRATEISQVRKEIRPELEKLNLQHKRVDTLKEQISTQEKKGMDTDKEIEELETEMEQLRGLQEKATKINLEDLSNSELRLIAIRHKDDEGFLSGFFGSSNPYQEELVRRIHKEKAVDAEISKAKKEPIKKEESLFGDFV
jgi:hypothetical protein